MDEEEEETGEEYFRFYDFDDCTSSSISIRKNITRFLIFGLEDIMFSGLEQLMSLRELWIVECKIKRIPNISHCINLEKLYVHSNEIDKLPEMQPFERLEVFWFSDNKVSDLQNLSKCQSLKELFFANNTIKMLNHLSDLTWLKTLNASGNPITDIQEVKNLKPLNELETLLFADPMYHLTPIVKLQNYRCFVVYNLPQLKNLDFFQVNKMELTNYSEYFRCMEKFFSTSYHNLVNEYYFKMTLNLCKSQETLESLKKRFHKCALIEKQAEENHQGELKESCAWERRHLETELLKWESLQEYGDVDDKKFEINVKLLDLEMKYPGNVSFQRYEKESQLLILCENLFNSYLCRYAKEAAVERVQVDRIVHIVNRLEGYQDELKCLTSMTDNNCPGLYLMFKPTGVKDVTDWPLEYIAHSLGHSLEPRFSVHRSLLTNCLAVGDHTWLNGHDVHKKIFLTKDKKAGRRVSVISFIKSFSGLKLCSPEEVRKYHVNEKGTSLTECPNCYILSTNLTNISPRFVVEFHYRYRDVMEQLEVILREDMASSQSENMNHCEQPRAIMDSSSWETIRDLNLSRLGIKRLGTSSIFPNIRTCDVSYNEFQSIDDLAEALPQLECLNISFNKIMILSSMKKFPSLQRLDISWNSLYELIPNLKYIEKNMPQLLFLDMSCNCFRDVHFISHGLYFVKKLLPNLKKFNTDWLRPIDTNIVKTFDGIYDVPLIDKGDSISNDEDDFKWKGIFSCTKGTKVRGSHATIGGPKRQLICLAFIGGETFHRLQIVHKPPALKWLTVTRNSLNSTAFLTNLDTIEEINLSRNLIASVENTSFSNMNSLARLDLSCNYLTSLKELKGVMLPSLKVLNISNNFLESLEGLEGATNIEELYASINKIASLHSLKSIGVMKRLLVFDLRKNPIKDDQDLKNFIYESLNSIEFFNGAAIVRESEEDEEANRTLITSDYLLRESNIKKPYTLTKLCLSHSSLNQFIMEGSILVNLKTLNLDGNYLKSLQNLCRLKKLQKLCLSRNQVRNFSEDEMAYDSTHVFENLEELHLDGNGITSLETLEFKRMPNLKTLFLQDNKLENISGLQHLSNLQHLILDRNNITSILPRDVHGLYNLTDLHMESNKLEELEFLLFLLKLKKLFLGYNNVKSMDCIQYLSALRSLKELTLDGNPIVSLPNIFRDLLKEMKNLKILNGFVLPN